MSVGLAAVTVIIVGSVVGPLALGYWIYRRIFGRGAAELPQAEPPESG